MATTSLNQLQGKTIDQLDLLTEGEVSGNELIVVRKDGLTKKYNAVLKPTKSTVGLGNVDNTSDVNKPISNATAAALAGKANSQHSHSIEDVAGLQNELDAIDGRLEAIEAGGGGNVVMAGLNEW